MDFERYEKQTKVKVTIPQELIGFWKIESRRYEFRANSRYYVHDLDVSYQLVDSGMTLIHSGTRYIRLNSDPNGLPGVWSLEEDPTEEWNLRSDGTYTYHWPGYEYFGEYSFDATTMSTSEMRSILSESSGTLTFDPPYAPPVSGLWTIVEPELTITFPSGDVIYTRE